MRDELLYSRSQKFYPNFTIIVFRIKIGAFNLREVAS
jgi:hypothetical protein